MNELKEKKLIKIEKFMRWHECMKNNRNEWKIT